MVSTTYTIQSFDQTFALIGGMAVFIYAIISLVIGSYQAFSFQNGMQGKLYTQDKETFERVYYEGAMSQ